MVQIDTLRLVYCRHLLGKVCLTFSSFLHCAKSKPVCVTGLFSVLHALCGCASPNFPSTFSILCVFPVFWSLPLNTLEYPWIVLSSFDSFSGCWCCPVSCPVHPQQKSSPKIKKKTLCLSSAEEEAAGTCRVQHSLSPQVRKSLKNSLYPVLLFFVHCQAQKKCR